MHNLAQMHLFPEEGRQLGHWVQRPCTGRALMLLACIALVVGQVQAQRPHTLQPLSLADMVLLKVLAGYVQVCLLLSLHYICSLRYWYTV